MASDPEKAATALFDRLIDNIKSSRPQGINDKPLEKYIYAQLAEGVMVDPDDFADAWSPMSGIPFEEMLAAAPTDGETDPTAATNAVLAQMSRAQRAFSAAFKTSTLVDALIQLRTDDIHFPAGLKLSNAYEGIITGMQAMPAPEPSAEVKARVQEAKKVLYDLDADGNILGPSRLYETYKRNADRYAQAKADFAEAQQEHLMDPLRAGIWPVVSMRYKRKVDQAWKDLKGEGGDRVEQALDTINSVGVSIDNHMIAKAKEIFDRWNLGLAGSVAVNTPFAYVLPGSWADPDVDDVGWKHLKVTNKEYRSHSAKHAHLFNRSNQHSESSSSEGHGGVSIFGFGAKGGGGSSSSSSSSTSSAGATSTATFSNSAKNLTIEIEYGVCTVERPWLLTDLFRLRNWYLVNNHKNAISDGTLDPSQNSRMLPLIPSQFLVVRNVKITAQEWGSDGEILERHFGERSSSSSSSSSHGGGDASFSFGFFSIGGGGSHRESEQNSSSAGSQTHDRRRRFKTTFRDGTLEMHGAQIVAWLSTVVPACAPLDDPGLTQREAGAEEAPVREPQPIG